MCPLFLYLLLALFCANADAGTSMMTCENMMLELLQNNLILQRKKNFAGIMQHVI